MHANAAIATILASVALFCVVNDNPRFSRYVQVLGLGVFLIGGVTLIQYIFDWSKGAESVLLEDAIPPAIKDAFPERIGINAGLGFTLIGIAIMSAPYKTKSRIWIAQSLSVVVGLVALASCLLYLFSFPDAGGTLNIRMTVHTAAVLFLLSFAILACHPDQGFMGVFTGAELGSIFARRLILLAIFLPSVISWIILFLIQNDWLKPFPGTSTLAFDAFLVTIAITACFTILVWKHAHKVREIELNEREARQKAEEAELKFQESADQLAVALEAAQMGTWQWNLKTNEMVWDAQHEILFGYSPGTAVRSIEDFKRVIHSEDVKDVLDGLAKSVENKKIYDKIYRVITPEGSTRWILGRGKCYYRKNGEPLKMMGVVADITLLKESEMRLKEALLARDEFLSIASHELKTPLTSLKMQSQLVHRAIEKSDPNAYSKENINRLVDQTERQVTRLTRLVDDMLDIARIRSGKLTVEPEYFDIAELVKDTVDRMKPQFLITPSGLPKINANTPTWGYWDRMRIEQVITNLLTNAIRYGQGKPIEIHVNNQPGFARLSVRDFGIGIAPVNKTKIFDRFERAVTTSEIGGLGLGLFITKQIVWSHGGKIWVESELGKGSTFYVDLPYNEAAASPRSEVIL